MIWPSSPITSFLTLLYSGRCSQKLNQPGSGALDDWAGVALMSADDDLGPVIVLENNARLEMADTVHAPARTMRLEDSTANIGKLVIRELVIEDNATLTLGEPAEHPHEHVLVQ